MTPADLQEPAVDLPWLTALAAECLGLPEEEIDPAVSLLRQGMDSVAAVQLVAAVADRLGRDVPEWLLLDYPDLNSLASYLTAARREGSSALVETAEIATTDDLMRADSVLPGDIRPPRTRRNTRAPRFVLLTGATGFLGAHVLRTLLRDTHARIYCLVRPEDGVDHHGRVRRNMEAFALWDSSFAARVRIITGDLLRPNLGLAPRRFDRLCRRVEAIYHCAAAVNWVLPYAALRGTNVQGTGELLRLACRHRPKAFHFVSTLAVCYAIAGPDEVHERDDMAARRSALPLGYAQSKCVAETLVRAAAGRGLPVSIHRLALLCGAAHSGIASTEDFLAAVIKGCVQMQAAPDLDWLLDACPVDFAADALVGLTHRGRPRLRVAHVMNPATRHWRELVLWMNLFGYPIRLVSYGRWLAQLEAETTTPEHPLYRLRSFFLARPAGAAGLTLPELYEEGRRSRACDRRTRRALGQLPLQCPELSARFLNRSFRSFIERGFLPPVTDAPGPTGSRPGQRLDAAFFRGILRRHYGDPALRVHAATALAGPAGDSILTELTSWRYGTTAGLSRHRLSLESSRAAVPRVLNVFVKVKPQDQQVMEVAERVAALCGTELGAAFARFKDRTGLAGCHLRELGVYAQQDERFRRHAPAVLGTVRDEERGHWILVLENLSAIAALPLSGEANGWCRPHVEVAVRGIAEVHAVWFGRETELSAQPWLGPTLSAQDMADMKDLWNCLADYSARFFTEWLGADLRPLQRDLIAGVGQWWPSLEIMPRTLIHNDFNPRNVALRRTAGELRLCAYDWELATLGVPQHDLAEFLCFVLPLGFSRADVLAYLEEHRLALERATGRGLDAASWQLGFALSLADLMVNRLPMYCLVHTFRRQPFLERVVRTWRALYEIFAPVGLGS